ncbi:MAG: protein-disulfide reductase DsbD [Marinobacter sp.]
MIVTATARQRPRAFCQLSALVALMIFLLAHNTAFAQQDSTFSSWFGDNSAGQGNFLPVDQALPFSYRTDGDALILEWNIAPEHYLYKSRISVTSVSAGINLGELEFERSGIITNDEFFGEMAVFYDPIQARQPIQLPSGVTEAELQVSYQGCASAGLCYPPQTRELLFYTNNNGSSIAAPGELSKTNTASDASNNRLNPANAAPDTRSATGLAGFMSQQPTWLIVGVFFLLGLGLTFTPCVLPMIPIISSLVSGQNTRSSAHALVLASSYVLGMALTYAAAGVVTGLLGASFNLQAQLQSPVVLSVFAALFIVFALAMFEVFELQLPAFIRNPLSNASQNLSGGRIASLFGIGALSALVVSPCVSAPLAGSLLYISATQDAVIGGLALLALGLGMGAPLIAVAVGGRKVLPTSGAWMTTVKHGYGIMLLAVAIWLLERMLAPWLTLTLWGLLIAVVGVQLGAFDAAKAGWQRTRKGLGLVAFAWGMALLAGALAGANDPLQPLAPFTAGTPGSGAGNTASHANFQRTSEPQQIRQLLQQAQAAGKPALLDLYADWCIACKVMERNVFGDAEVIQALAPYSLIQLDMTANTPQQQALLDELGLFGPPGILFYNVNGQEIDNQRILGEMNRGEFLQHLNGVDTRG